MIRATRPIVTVPVGTALCAHQAQRRCSLHGLQTDATKHQPDDRSCLRPLAPCLHHLPLERIECTRLNGCDVEPAYRQALDVPLDAIQA